MGTTGRPFRIERFQAIDLRWGVSEKEAHNG